MNLFVFVGDREFIFGQGILATPNGYTLAEGYQARFLASQGYWVAIPSK